MPIRLFTLLLLMAALSLSVSGCKSRIIGDGSGEDEGPQTLKKAKEHWESLEINSYSVEAEQHCFCGGPIHYKMTVRNGDVAEIINLETREPFEQHEAYFTISEWFDWLEQAAEKDPVKLELEFNPHYGYPIFVDYDQAFNIADEEIRLTFKNLERL